MLIVLFDVDFVVEELNGELFENQSIFSCLGIGGYKVFYDDINVFVIFMIGFVSIVLIFVVIVGV